MKKKYLSLSHIILFTIVLINQLVSQTTGKIAGQVYDNRSGEPLPGANIIIEGTNLGASTDLEGSFYIINVSPGKYTASVQMIGYKTMKVENLKVSVNRTAFIDAGLNEEMLEGEVIVVQADKLSSKKDQTGSMKAISSEEMEILPVENVNDVVSLQAGVVNGHFRGGRRDEVTYLIDGVQVDDAFGGSGAVVALETEAVSDLEVITGTFNAEYGRAMSGVVNQVTKDGENNFYATASAGAATYLTSHDDIFIGLGEIDPFRQQDYKVSMSGPVLKNKLFFFFNTRFQDNKNHLNGIRRFNVNDYSDFSSNDSAAWVSEANGDGKYVPMNDSKNLSLLAKLSYKVTNRLKTSLLYTLNDDEWNGYSHVWKYNPDGLGTTHRETDMIQFQVNHMLSDQAFYQLNLSYVNNSSGYYLFEDPLSENYVHDGYSRSAEHTGFLTGGQAKGHNLRVIKDYNAKFDLTWQINNRHSMKAGVLFIQHQIDNKERQIQNYYRNTDLEEDTMMVNGKVVYSNYLPEILSDTSTVSDIYKVDPYEFSGYIQDKMEFEDMVINLGLRLDYFDPSTVYPSNRRNPDNELTYYLKDENGDYILDEFGNKILDTGRKSDYLDADKKIQLSPRLSLAYQLGKKAVLRFSYGHFFQLPPMYSMFQNHSFRVGTSDYQTTMGNSQLKAQKTVQYEIGLWQEILQGLGLEVALYYRDIYNLLSVGVVSTYNQTEYGLYTNKDYGNTKGLELRLDYGIGSWFANINYTLQYTRGNADNPFQTYSRAGQNQDPVNRMIVMSWDQRHTFNTTIGYQKPNFGTTAIVAYNSGSPYTWVPISTSDLIDINLAPNNDYTPPKFNIDLYAFYRLSVSASSDLQFDLKIYNLLDRLNEYGVNPTTGRTYTAVIQESDLKSHRSNFNTYLDRINDPGGYSAPRLIKLGIGITF